MDYSEHAPGNAIHDLQTRFLYPFFFRRYSVQEAAKALLNVQIAGRAGQQLALWECAGPHDLYREEVLEHVVDFLFPDAQTAGCAYLRLAGAIGNRWFDHLEALLPGGVQLPVRLVSSARVEIFLSSYGVGVLSMALTPARSPLRIPEAIEFNYRLSQLRWGNAGKFHIPHPAEEAQRWERIPPEDQQHILAAPDRQAPLSERLGRRGGTFTPPELIEELLCPLETFDLRQIQDGLSVYTVARFGAEVDFASPETCATYAPLLGALTQVEESTHAGALAEAIGVTNALLNRCHWAGVGLLGAAHLVADQSPVEHDFNKARVPHVFFKYFIPYLVALMQCHTLHQIVAEAGEIVLSPHKDTAKGLAELRTHLLEFAVSGHFTHVSTREALHRYYRMCQEGLDVRHALDNARQAIADIDARDTDERHVRMAQNTAASVAATKEVQESMRKHLATVADVQRKVEWIEIFLVSVYFAHLWHMIAPEIHWKLLEHQLWIMPLKAWGILLAALLAGLITALCLRPWHLSRH